MPIDGTQTKVQRLAFLEGGLLAVAAPWLVFPTLVPFLTLIALILLPVLWLWRWRATGRPLVATPFNFAMLVLAMMLVPALLVTSDPDLTLPKATGVILGLALWRFISIYVASQRRLVGTVLVYFLLGLGVVVAGAFSAQWQLEVPFLRMLEPILPPQLLRLPGQPSVGVHPNELAGTLSLMLPFAIALLIGWRPERLRATLLGGLALLTVLMTVLLALTGSRSGWAAFIAGLACLVVLWAALTPSRRKLIWIGLLLGAGFAVLFALWLGPEQWQQLWQEPPRETPFGTLSTLSFRQEIWRWALAAIRSFPLTGTGLGTFRRVVFRFYPIAVVPDYDPAHAHNVFLQVALDVGLPGLVAYLALLMVAAVIAWRVARRNAALRPFAIGLFAGLVAFHAFGILDAIALGQKPAFLLWMTLGMLAALTRIDAKTAGKPALQN